MALQLRYVFPLLMIVALSCTSCYGRNIPKHRRHDVQNIRRALGSVQQIFNVDDYGAKGDGNTDDTLAFQKTWEQACSSSGGVLMVPSNKNYLLKQITFSGPCNSDTTVQISGTILASKDRSDFEKDKRHWLIFKKIDNLSFEGGGVIDGNGEIWWENSCKINKKLALTLEECDNLAMSNLNIQNAQQMHVSFQTCHYVRVTGVNVTSPGHSPNTDGIHITSTNNIQVSNTNIATGDDCFSIESGSKTVRVTNVTCGPGHGISIGSLGDNGSEAHVSDIIVNGATLSGTTNGLRIKTWQGGSGVASNIKFQNIVLDNVDNPIIIDQEYCDQKKPCKKQVSAVQVKDVLYQNIRGTSSSEKAVVFDCSEDYPCEDITMENVKIESSKSDETTKAKCSNVQIAKAEDVSPQC
ncbi:polygalacturonase isoform X2 [Spinacia oleracea]|uniref:Polygalacturonase isoform X2 n=1 Tax=Spinacia oleracea TaxID=3562 RepID=A0ABM3REB5_SPIOL|nr:polygalacturonase-like isoform X2 [Spinacia oleracea]